MSGEQVQITVAHEKNDHPVAFGSLWPAWAIERAICTACKVPWGSVIQIMDEEGVIHVIDAVLLPPAAPELQPPLVLDGGSAGWREASAARGRDAGF